MKVIAAFLAVLLSVVYFYLSSDQDVRSISPTAHYTGYIWLINGLSDPRLRTSKGKLLFSLLEPFMFISRARGGPTAEEFLLARHQMIDFQLQELVDSGKVTQIIELAAGLSPRGLRFKKRYGNKISYIEADLPDMISLKRDLLGVGASAVDEHHRFLDVDVLQEKSMIDLVDSLNTSAGAVFVTEGLLNYFDEDTVKRIWKNTANQLSRFSSGVYVSDIHLNKEYESQMAVVKGFRWMLSAFVGRPVHLLFPDRLSAEWALIESGFLSAIIHRPQDWVEDVSACGSPGARLVHIIAATVNSREDM